MKGVFLKAAAKKLKFLAKKKKIDTEEEDLLSEVDEIEVSENMLGNLYNDRYISLKYLGHGTFSRVWLVYDVRNDSYHAMKMYYPKYEEDAQYEIKYHKQMGSQSNVVSMLDYFAHKSSDESHYCLIVDLMGKSLMSIYDKFIDGVTFDMFQQIARQSLASLHQIHAAGLIHTDIKLENLMITQLTGSVLSVIDWFNKQNPQETYNQILEQMIPPNWNEMNKTKQKKLKRKLKDKSVVALVNHFKKPINDYVNEIGQYKVDLDNVDKKSEDQHSLHETDDELPELVNLDNLTPDETPDKTPDETPETKEESANDETPDETPETKEESANDETPDKTPETKEESANEMLDYDDLDLDVSNINVKIADMGNACPIDNIDDDDIQIRSYRAPEVVMGEIYNEKVDIWSMACLFYELITHDYLFEVESEHDDNVEQDRYLLSQMYSVLGKMPVECCLDCERTYDLFDEKGRVKKFKKIDYYPLEDRLREKRPDLTEDQRNQIASLIRGMLNYNVKQRFSANECLKHPIFSIDMLWTNFET